MLDLRLMEINIREKGIKAVAMLSGGLDSMLAARIVQEQGVEVIGVHFSTGFCTLQRRRRVALPDQFDDPRLQNDIWTAAASLHVPIELIDVSEQYLPIVLNPRHGYGSRMNPCQDCRAFMLGQAKVYMEAIDAQFIVTGEVCGQRPNSQKRHLLYQTEKEAGLRFMVLRPLSAKLLRPTIPEQEGWVNRDQLFDISGRSRRRQIELAAQFGITEFAQPAGGCCMLVEESFSRRLVDFLTHNPLEALNLEEVALLSVGRHFRLYDGTKAIVGRNEGENNFLERARRPGDWRFEATSGGSPVALVKGPLEPDQRDTVAAIVAGYSRHKDEATVLIEVDDGKQKTTTLVAPRSSDQLWELNVGAALSSRQVS